MQQIKNNSRSIKVVNIKDVTTLGKEISRSVSIRPGQTVEGELLRSAVIDAWFEKGFLSIKTVKDTEATAESDAVKAKAVVKPATK